MSSLAVVSEAKPRPIIPAFSLDDIVPRKQVPYESDEPPKTFALHDITVHGPVDGEFRRGVRESIRATVIKHCAEAPAKVGITAIEMALDAIECSHARAGGPSITVKVTGAINGRRHTIGRLLKKKMDEAEAAF